MDSKDRKATIKLITDTYYALMDLGACNDLRDAYDIAAKQERQHRAMGRRWVGTDKARCAASVDVCAMLFAARGMLQPSRLRSYSDRADFLAAYGAASRVERSPDGKRKLAALRRKYRAKIEAVDYCALVGHK